MPAELRNQIYDLVIEDSRTHQLLCLEDRDGPQGRKEYRVGPFQPALALTSRQIRHEVLSKFYGERVFDITLTVFNGGDTALLDRWSRLARPSLQYLQKVRGVFYFTGATSPASYRAGGQRHVNPKSRTQRRRKCFLCQNYYHLAVCCTGCYQCHLVIEVEVTATRALLLRYVGAVTEYRNPKASPTEYLLGAPGARMKLGYCKCVVEQRARAAEVGSIGELEDTPVVRFFKSWAKDRTVLPTKYQRSKVCRDCGHPVRDLWLY